MSTIVAQICIRRDTAANFTSANPTLALGEIAYETDTRNIKVGDGATAWTALGYINPYRGGNPAAPTSNTVIGSGAGAVLESGATDNVLLGATAGDSITTGDQCVVIGSGADVAAATNVNSIVIGNGAVGNGSNTTTIGNSSTTGTWINGDLIVTGNDISGSDNSANNRLTFGGTQPACALQNSSTYAMRMDIASNVGRVGSTNSTDVTLITNSVARVTLPNNSGDVRIANGNLVMSTAGTGIDFSATANSSGTMTSELLSDYEEGTWTPAYSTDGTGFTTMTMDGGTVGRYTKIGRMVTVFAYLTTDNVDATGATGTVTVTGLPFTVSGSSGFFAGSIAFVRLFAASGFPCAVYAQTSTTYMKLEKRAASNGTTAFLAPSDLVAGANNDQNQLMICLSYFV